MDYRSQPPLPTRDRDRALAVLHTLMQLGPGAHKFRSIANHTHLDDSEIQRRLRQLHHAGLCDRAGYGYWELRHTSPALTDTPALVHPITTPLLDVDSLLAAIHRRTEQVVLLHTYSPVSSERLCIATAGTSDVQFRRELAITPTAVSQLRQAPLHSDAPGLVMLAHLAAHDASLREDLRSIRSTGIAVTDSPLPRWSLLSAPVRRLPGAPAAPGAEPGVVAAVSILTPERPREALLAAYGALLRNAARAAVKTSVVAPARTARAPTD